MLLPSLSIHPRASAASGFGKRPFAAFANPKMSAADRENSLWRLVGSFGWTVQVPRGQWDFPKASKEVMEKVFEEHQNGGEHPPERRTKRTTKHFSRDKKLSSRARVRPAPPPFEANRGKGTSLRWLPTLTDSDQKDDRFGPILSKHYKSSPDQTVRVGKPSKAELKQVPRPRTADHRLRKRKSYHFKTQMHPVYLHRVKSLSKMPDSSMATFMLSNEESKPENSQDAVRQEMHDDFCMYTPDELPLELKSPTAKHHHKSQQHRLVEITITYPTRINEITLLKIKALIEKKHHFKPCFPDEKFNRAVNKRGRKRLTENDENFVNTYKWQGPLKDLWALGEEIRITYPTEFLLSCDDFYVLARGQGWCKTYHDKPLSDENRHKIIHIVPLADAASSVPTTAPSSHRESVQSPKKKVDLRKQYNSKKKQQPVPYEWPGKEVKSQHRNLWAPDFPVSTREQHEQMQRPKSNPSMIGPGSFQFPTSMQRQVESIKRNMVDITSMKTKTKRQTPLQNCALGYIESPGPQVYVPPSMIRTDIGVRFGPGIIDPYKIRRMEKSLKQQTRKGKTKSKEQLDLEKLENEIKRLQHKTFIMRRGIKKLAGTKELLLR